jgi:predicted metal-dependent HD superfamily phosphohydrolase
MVKPAEFLARLPTREKVIDMMTEKVRIYHNLSHAMDLARLAFCDYKDNLSTEDDLRFHYYAAFYHDIIYVPGAKDNEEKSISEFIKDLDVIFQSHYHGDASIIDDVLQAIRLSANHFQEKAYSETVSKRVRQFLDYDLYGLAAPKAEYQINTQKIRLEFNEVSPKDWTAGRKAWIKSSFAAPRIFRFNSHKEDAAQRNLALELASLYS